MRPVDNLHVRAATPLLTPDDLHAEIPVDEALATSVGEQRQRIQEVIAGDDDRLLVIVGPCSVHDPEAALEYADWLADQAQRYADDLVVCMRVYFEKPRTTVGWKGLINDPHLDGSHDLETGLRLARRLLQAVLGRGLATASEMLDPIIPQYLADLVCWAAIGARTTESQTHREMASGLSMPVGFKNGMDGGCEVAVNAMIAARQAHSFLGIDGQGRASIIRTEGNPHTHLVLRGGSHGPNFHREAVAAAAERLRGKGCSPRVLVDCSHGNSEKDHRRQAPVAADLAAQLAAGSTDLLGVMLESNLVEGRQDYTQRERLRRGQSITDACIGLDTTGEILADLARGVASGRRHARSTVDQTED